MKIFQNFFTDDELDSIRNLPEVSSAYKKLSIQTNVYFSIPASDFLKDRLRTLFDLNLDSLQSVPCRWIKGDTPAHIDRGHDAFEDTYLVYITESEGQFHIEDKTYPIEAGTGFTFSEGLSHEVTDTNNTSRLLLGPMSENGFAVGAGGIAADGATTTVYVYYVGATLSYRYNNDDAFALTLPIAVSNTNVDDKAANPLKIIFEENITLSASDAYFDCETEGIQFGSTSIETDGSKISITIDGVTGYLGLIQNGVSGLDGHSSISIYNLDINVANSSTLANGAGWFGQEYFGKNATNNYIINCSSSGNIPLNAGGILGQYAANRTAGTTSLTVIGCSSTGTIGTSAGGIAGKFAGNGSGASLTIQQCWSEGTIGSSAGGIVGESAGSSSGSVDVSKCYSTGSIDNAGGGVFGRFGGAGGSASATKCYSSGSIGLGAGGIFGREAGTSSGSATATNCYSTGSIDSTLTTGGGGIFGRGYENQVITNCYTVGAVTNGARGYILANSDTQPSTTYSEAKNGGISWSDTNANSVLTGDPTANPGVGTTWVSKTLNTAYELVDYGPTPYQTQTISGNTLVQSKSQSVSQGNLSDQALNPDASGNAFSIVGKTGGDSMSYDTITISAQTGAISTTAATAVGTYTIYVRSVGSYFITQFILTVIAFVAAGTTPSTACCVTTIGERGLSYEQINDYLIGNRLLNQHTNDSPMKFNDYAEYVRFKMAQGSRKY
jgi:hypothetical protein